MALTVYAFVLSSWILSVGGIDLKLFYEGLITYFDVSQPVILMDSTECGRFDWFPRDVPTTFLCYASNDAHIAMIEALFNDQKGIDMVFFLGGVDGGLAKVASRLSKSTGLFTSKTVVVMPETANALDGIPLRLSSRVFMYKQIANDTMDLLEAYAVKNGPRKTSKIGVWSQNVTATGAFNVKEGSMWVRRSDLMGLTLVATTVQYPVMAILTEAKDGTGRITHSTGYLMELLHQLEKRMNFTAEVKISIDGKFGGVDKDGKWNGMVGMVMDGKADMCVAPLTQTFARDEVIDFTIPLQREITTLLSPVSKGQATNFWVYMEIFPFLNWFVCVLAVLVLSGCLWAISFAGMDAFHDSRDPERFTFLNGLAVNLLFLIQMGYSVVAFSLSSRILLFASGLMAYLVFSYYTCDLTARMTSGPPDIPIRQDNNKRKWPL